MPDLKHERKVVEKFVRLYNTQNNTNFIIDHYPEDNKDTPTRNRIEAIYKDKDEAIAIEHTSLDSYIDQRKKEEEFIKALGPLQDDLKNKLPTPGYYSLIVLANCIMPRKIQWNKFRADVRDKIVEQAHILKLPQSGRLESLKIKIEQIPFEFYLCRHNLDGKLNGVFHISKFVHDADDLDKQKETIVEKALKQKTKKLLVYARANCRTILLFELVDYDWDGIYRSFANSKKKFSQSDLPAEIYVINTSFPSWWCSNLKKGNDFSSWDEFIKYDEINKEISNESSLSFKI